MLSHYRFIRSMQMLALGETSAEWGQHCLGQIVSDSCHLFGQRPVGTL